jgi:glycosyltransferase 2 family protein
LVAERAGVPVPGVVLAGMAATGDAVLVTDQPAACVPLAGLPPAAVTDELLARVWRVAGTLREGGIGHGRLNAASVVLTGGTIGDGTGGDDAIDDGAIDVAGGELVVTDWSAARMGAPDDVLATDLAELLVSTALVGGSAPALAAARAAVGDEAVRAAVPFVQHAALSPWARDAVRAVDFDVDGLRQRAAEATGAADDEVAELRRLRWRDLLLVGLTLVAAYTLIGQLADIGIDTILEELAGADLAWLIAGLAIAQVPLLCDAVAMLAAVGRPLPFGPTTVLESAIKFINLSVPSVAGKLALTIRYLQRQGVPSAVAVAQGALDSAAGFVVQVLLLLVVLPGLDVQLPEGDGDASAIIWIGVAVGAAAVVGALVVVLVPRLRAKVAPAARSALGSVRELLASPSRLVRLLLANVGSQLAYALVLGISLRALSASAAGSVSLADLIFVNTAVTLFAGVAPVPGGIGIAEAGLTAALVAVGVPQSTALATAIVHRLLTYYLPPVWGFVSLRWLGKRDYV